MNTKAAETESALDRLRADMARHQADMTRRDKADRLWFAVMIVAFAVLIIVAIGPMIRSGG